jgi:hypothetical protein
VTTCCPCRDAGLASSLNYNMHKIPLYPMVRIASPLTLLMLTSRHCGPATGGQYKYILVIHSSFLMRLLSHNPLSTPCPHSWGNWRKYLRDTLRLPAGCIPLVSFPRRRESSRRAGREKPNPPPLSILNPLDPPNPRQRGIAPSAHPISLVEAQHAVPLHPPGQSPLHRRERIRVRVTATVTDTPGLQPGGLLALFCHSRASP